MSLRFSQEIKLLLAKLANKPIAIAEILQETAERGFSFIIGLLVLPLKEKKTLYCDSAFGSGSIKSTFVKTDIKLS